MSVAPHIRPVLDQALAAFQQRFGRRPEFAASAPGRVNLIGEHTDYSGGFVLPIAIDRVCVAVATRAAVPNVSRVCAVDLDQVGQFDFRRPIELKNPDTDVAGGIERGSWLSYVAGVAAQLQRHPAAGALPNLDIAITSSVPVGSGLSSSASLEVAVASLLEAAAGVRLEPTAKALLCQAAEHEFAGVPCGIMDQFISVLGREGHALMIDCRSQEASPVPMPPADRAAVVVLNTNVHHALASGEYAKRHAACESAAKKLRVSMLCEVAPEHLDVKMREANLTQEEQRCVRHVVMENRRTHEAASALAKGELPTMGRLMLESHVSLRDDYRVSCPELDCVVDAACAVRGVFGARMTGGGFGGCAIAMTSPDAMGPLRDAVNSAYQSQFGRECTVFRVIPSAGAATVLV